MSFLADFKERLRRQEAAILSGAAAPGARASAATTSRTEPSPFVVTTLSSRAATSFASEDDLDVAGIAVTPPRAFAAPAKPPPARA
jgi:hypothetical protein